MFVSLADIFRVASVCLFPTSRIIRALFKIGLFGWGPGQPDLVGGMSAQGTELEPIFWTG